MIPLFRLRENNVKYLVPSSIPIYPSILSNLIRKGSESIKVLHECDINSFMSIVKLDR